MSRVVELLCSRRVPQVAALALMSFGFAGCSADMQTRLSQNNLSNPFASQPETTSSVRTPAVERRELPQYSRPQVAIPVTAAAAADRGAAVLSGRAFRRVRRRARAVLLRAADASAARDHGDRRPALGRGGPRAGSSIGPGRHHDHRRHQRHARNLVAPLQRFVRRDPAGQWLQGTARAVARPATDHSPSDRGRRSAGAGRWRRLPASRSLAAASTVHVVNRGDTLLSIARRNNVPVADLAKANGLDSSAKLKLGQKLTVPGAKSAAAAHRCPAGRRCRRSARGRTGDPNGCRRPARPRKARGSPRPRPRWKTRLRLKPRSRPVKQPARCRPSAGRCAAR